MKAQCEPGGRVKWFYSEAGEENIETCPLWSCYVQGVVLLQLQPFHQAASQITAGPSPSAHSLSQ